MALTVPPWRLPMPEEDSERVSRATSRRFPTSCTGTRRRALCGSAARSMSTCFRRAMPAARPARTSRPGFHILRPAGTRRHGASSSPTIRCRRSTAGSVTTPARASATAPSSTAPFRSTRSSGSSAISRWRRAGSFDAPPYASGKRVLVIGAGPSGLSAAYHLARLGHEVEIRDAGDEPGGMMRYGIPAYRLPREILTGELDRIEALGVRMTCGHRVENLLEEWAEGRFDAVFVAVGRASVEASRHPREGRRADRRRRVVPAQRRLRRASRDRPPSRCLRGR